MTRMRRLLIILRRFTFARVGFAGSLSILTTRLDAAAAAAAPPPSVF